MQPIRSWDKINGKYKPGEKKCSFSGHVRTCSFFQIKKLEKMAANTHRNEDIRKAVDNLIRLVQNSANSKGEIPIAWSNSISTSNSISISSSNSVSSVMVTTRSMIQASSRNFNRLRSNERLRASGKAILLHEL